MGRVIHYVRSRKATKGAGMIKIICNGRTFTNDNIISGECYIARSLLSSSLEIETLEFSAYSTDQTLVKFSVDSKVTLSYNNKHIKTFYLQEIKRSGKYVYDFSAVSIAGVLDKRSHYGGIYNGQTVKTVVTDIFGTLPISVASNVANIKLYGWLPVATRRESLAQVLFATSAVLVENNGVFTVSGLSTSQKRAIGKDDTSYNAEIEYTSPISDVVVLEHQYTAGAEETTLFEGTTSAGDVITFSEPCHSLVASGFSITSRGANYAIVSSGSGKLTGKKYIHSTREVKGSPTTRATSGNEQKVRVEDATLVSLVNSRAVADRLADYYAQSERIISDITYQYDDAGNVVSQYHPYDEKMVQSCIESLDITFSARLLAKSTTLVGYIPPDISQIEYYDTFEILTGSGTWTPPKGSKNGRAVLIGAGTGGQSGTDGKIGELSDQPLGGLSGLVTATKYGRGGDGGNGGAPGQPGKVYQIDIDIVQGKTYSYRCGSAGTGGISDGTDTPVNGNAGGNTTFDSYSSSSGSIPSGGFLNPLDGITYAKQGENGVPGAKGGDGGYFNLDAEEKINGLDGESVGSASGGKGGKGYWGSEVSARAGGGGGGAAEKSAGTNGTDGKPLDYNNQYGHGGNGGTPAKPSKPNYGSAGNGGHGGGGAGGGGGYISDRGRAQASVFVNPSVTQGTPGKASPGGDGGDGCIILFYSLPRKVE